jgi:Uma2 family endonuclease
MPDWVCEVHTLETRALDLVVKRERYRHMGISHLWLIDAEARVLEAFALVDDC